MVFESKIGSKNDVAQLDPRLFTEALWAETKKMQPESQVRFGSHVVGLTCERSASEPDSISVKSLVLSDGFEVDCSNREVVFAMGPWTSQVGDWIKEWETKEGRQGSKIEFPSVSGEICYSIELAPRDPSFALSHPDALFVNYLDIQDRLCVAEVFPRSSGLVYLCSDSYQEPKVPDDPEQVKGDDDICGVLEEFARGSSTQLQDATLVKKQACYIPTSRDSLPLIGRLPLIKNGVIAAGHTCWGILNAPSTGLLVSELLVDGRFLSLDDPDVFSPCRLSAFPIDSD